MTTKHTPGPWSVGVGCKCRIYSGGETHAIARTYGPELNGIGVCELTGPKNEADARLIAAAPDLLAALREIEAHHVAQNELKGRPQSRSHTLSICRAAIAKAEGQEP